MNSRSGEGVYGTHGVNPTGFHPVVDCPVLSQISCLSGTAEDRGEPEENFGNKNAMRESDLDFVRLCKEGGHKGLLEMGEQSKNSEPVPYERKGGDWYYQDNTSENGGVTPHSNFRDTDSEFVKLSKQGGHEGLLKIASGGDENPFVNSHGRYIRKEGRISPASSLPAGMQATNANIAPGNPIWLGGSGPEKGFIPGKRFMHRAAKESPFATSEDWNCTQGRNPDKI